MTIMAERPVQRATGRGGARLAYYQRPRREWLPEADCQYEDPELFYEYVSSIDREKAKAICRSCPVMAECFAEVMAQEAEFGGSPQQNRKYRFGVRAGVTSGERWALEYPAEAAAERERMRNKAERAA
jgi:WhiB family redox-sensing transcriptional regulator